MNYYVITLSAETISRKTDIWVEPPTLENIFSEDRMVKPTFRTEALILVHFYR